MRAIDENIKKVLWNAVKKRGSVLQLSRLLGVSHSTVLFWMNGKIKNISTDIWCGKVYPFLEDEFIRHFPDLSVGDIRQKYCSGMAENGLNVVSVPLLDEQALLRFELPFENMERYACRNSSSCVAYEGSPGHKYYAVFLERPGELLGAMRGGVVFFMEHDFLRDDCVVLAKLCGRQFLTLCHYLRKDALVCLREVRTGKDIDSWTLGKGCGCSIVEWLFPVVNVRIFCRERLPGTNQSEKIEKKPQVSA